MRRFLTSLAFSLNAFAFGAITWAAFVASYGHTRVGDVNTAAAALGIGLVAYAVMIVSALPTAQRNLVAMLSGPLGRFFARLGAVALVFCAFVVASVTVLPRSEPLFGVIGTGHVLLALLAYAILMVLAFVVPGLAYPRPERPRPAPEPEVYSARAMASTRVPAAGRPRAAEAPAAPVRRSVRIVQSVLCGALVLPAYAAFYGSGWAWFLPAPEHIASVEGWLVPVTLAALPVYVLFALYLPLGEPRGPLGRVIKRHRWLQRSMVVLVLTAFAFAIPPALQRGLPALHSLAVTAPVTSAEVIVVERGELQRSKTCDRTVKVTFTGAATPSWTMCEVPRDIWDTVRPGDRLTLTGYRTRYGFRYESVARP
jgi:hypothetical protein